MVDGVNDDIKYLELQVCPTLKRTRRFRKRGAVFNKTKGVTGQCRFMWNITGKSMNRVCVFAFSSL